MNLIERVVAISRRRSPWICRLNAGSCNGCDIEITPLLSPRYDAEQLGVELHGTPKHADIVLISGTLTLRSREAILDIYAQVPNPKAVVALGSCPASGNVFAGSPLVLSESLDSVVPVDVWVPGCPPRPQAILDGIARAAKLLEDGATKSQLQNWLGEAVMNAVWSYLIAFAVWPGLLFAAPLGWLELWFMRKLVARLQGRRGPPFFQPFFDFMKLLGKETVIPRGVNRGIFLALPLVSVGAVTAALAIVPLPGNPVPSLPGDVVLLLYLMEVPVLCEVLAGYVSRSIYGQVAAMREALLSLAYNLPFLVAIIAMAQEAGSFQMSALQAAPYGVVHLLAGATFLLALPARMKLNPFSIANAEHEIVADSHIEYSGPPLALFKLSHAVELVLLTELFAVVFIPATPWPLLNLLVYLAAGVAVLGGVTLLATATARLRLAQAFRFYWVWGGIASAVTMAATLVR